MKIEEQIQCFKNIPFTHGSLVSLLKDYKCPNDKIAKLIADNYIHSIKRGLYVLTNRINKYHISKELLANLIYGPSYVSGDYALSYFGLIPERVYKITSITLNRAKKIATDFGEFEYIKAKSELYDIGLTSVKGTETDSFIIASSTKALCDKIIYTKNINIFSLKDMNTYLLDDLRIDQDNLKEIDIEIVDSCIKSGHKQLQLDYLYQVLKEIT